MHRLTGQWSGSDDYLHDRRVNLTSCRFRANPFIVSGAGRDVTATRTLTVTSRKHVVVSRENDSIGDW